MTVPERPGNHVTVPALDVLAAFVHEHNDGDHRRFQTAFAAEIAAVDAVDALVQAVGALCASIGDEVAKHRECLLERAKRDGGLSSDDEQALRRADLYLAVVAALVPVTGETR